MEPRCDFCGRLHSMCQCRNSPISSDARHIARMIAGAILFSNGDYDNEGLRHDVDRIEKALLAGDPQ